jgi:hypothetical protein
MIMKATSPITCAAAVIAAVAAIAAAQPTVHAPPTTSAAVGSPAPVVAAPPDRIFASFREEDRAAARAFYAKHVDIGGLSILAGAAVADEALLRTHEIVGHMLAGRPDVLKAMQRAGTRLIIIGRDQVYTDMPDYRNHPEPAYVNERVRGTGGLDVTSFGEENLLNLPIDRYDDESIAVHEFLHTIDAALEEIDPAWRQRLRDTFENALSKRRWNKAYASGNPAEYWAEIAQSYFDCNRVNNWNHAGVGSREQLKTYDPEGYELVRSTMRLTASNDWRFTPMRRQPSVISPPKRFDVDPYFTKFTYARELPIIASPAVSDEAMLLANDAVRKLFAYRHDILKALINDGARLIILGRDERLSELPQLRKTSSTQPSWDEARHFDYSPELKLMVVPEENLLGTAGEPFAGGSSVVRAMARAAFTVTANRPIDEKWDQRPQQVVQQYELRVQRLDQRFKARLQTLFDEAASKKLWLGTSAANDLASYWSSGVEAYFDAAGAGEPPVGTARPITTRETLKVYDPSLHDLVDEVFAYNERIDWRFTR